MTDPSPAAVLNEQRAEQKYEDEGGRTIRFSKEDRKEQSAISRGGTKEPPSHRLTEQIISDRPPKVTTTSLPHSGIQHVTGFEAGSLAPKGATSLPSGLSVSSSTSIKDANQNAALAPLVQPSELAIEKSALHHISPPAANEFGSIHMPSPLPGTAPSDIGEAAAEGWEKIKQSAAPSIEKAKELFHLGKHGEHSSSSKSSSSSNEPSMIDRATQVYEANVKPQVKRAAEIFKSNIAQRKSSTSTTSSTTSRPVVRTYTAPYTHTRHEPWGHRLHRYRARLQQIWEGREPIVRTRAQQAYRWIRTNKMEIPLLLLSTLLIMWASMIFIQWMAFPKYSPEREQVIPYETIHPPIIPTHEHPAEFVNINVDQQQHPGVIEQMKMKAHELGDRISEDISEGIDTLKMKATDRLHHVKDAVKDAIPSTDELKAKLTGAKAQVEEVIPSTDDIKTRASDLREHVVESMENLKDTINSDVKQLKEKIASAGHGQEGHTINVPAHEPGAPPHMHTIPVHA
jgi:hypothetical protein